MHDYDPKKVIEIFIKWIFIKDIDKKNDNESIKKHNNKLIKFCKRCLKRLKFWKRQRICNDKNGLNENYNLLQNFCVILFCFPEQLNKFLMIMESEYKRMEGAVGHILGWTKACCKHCNGAVDYKYSATRKPKVAWKCRKCKKHYSCFSGTWKDKFRQTSTFDLLQAFYSILVGIGPKQYCSLCVVSEKKHTRIRYHLSTTLKIYAQHNYIVLGDGNKHCYFDHIFKGVKRKYRRGYVKKQRFLLFGGTDDYGLYVLQVVDSERKIETNYYIQKHSIKDTKCTTDCGKGFGDIESLDQRKHLTCNHSGTLKDGILYYFTNPFTGACSNPIEGVFGRFVQKFTMKQTNDLKRLETLENGIAFFDFQFNRTNNYPQQLFINLLMAYDEIYNQGNELKVIPRKDFTDIYEVQQIISDRESKTQKGETEYLLHWKGYRLDCATWHHVTDLVEGKELLEQYNLLSIEDKNKRIKRYNQSIARRIKTEIENNAIPRLTFTKCKNIIHNKQITDAIKIIKNDGLLNVVQERHEPSDELQSQIIKVEAMVLSQTALELNEEMQDHYTVNMTFEDGTPVDFECNCKAYKQNKTQNNMMLCKHCAVVIIELSLDGQAMLKKQ